MIFIFCAHKRMHNRTILARFNLLTRLQYFTFTQSVYAEQMSDTFGKINMKLNDEMGERKKKCSIIQ